MLLISLFTLFTVSQAEAAQGNACHKPIVIAVVDTGFAPDEQDEAWFYKKYKNVDAHLCKFGHRDFTGEAKFHKDLQTSDAVPVDTHGHGTNIVGLVSRYASLTTDDYCIVVLKYYSHKNTGPDNVRSTVAAFEYAAKIKVDIINYSGGGSSTSNEERAAIKKFLDQGGILVAAAGNENQDIDKHPYYPAMEDPRIVVVGSKQDNDKKLSSSNFGKSVKRWEFGADQKAFGISLTGTSQATAITTGKIVGETQKACDSKGKNRFAIRSKHVSGRHSL